MVSKIINFFIKRNRSSKNPLVSMIMPAYNREKYIGEAIESALSQTYPNWELIIVDDGSTDNTLNIIKEYANKDKRVRYHVNEKNLGIPTSRNIAIKLARGKYIGHLDSDDILNKECIKKCVYEVKKDQEISLIYTDLIWFNNDDITKRGLIKKEKEEIYKRYEQFLPTAFSFYLKSTVINEGLLNEKMIVCDDLNLWIKILKKYKVKHITEPLYYWRIHGKNTSLNIHPLNCMTCQVFKHCLVPAAFPSYRNYQKYEKTKENKEYWIE